jgi:hypothetical protein
LIPDKGKDSFLFTTMSRLALGPTQPRGQWILGADFTGMKWPGHEVALSPPSSATVMNAWGYPFTPPYIFMAWYLVKDSIKLHEVVLS